MRSTPSSIYVHIPFCRQKCHYCSFNSYPGMEGLFESYVQALALEISRAGGGDRISTVYFGGGTPTVLSAEKLCRVLSEIRDAFSVDSDVEVTLESNPGTVDLYKLAVLRQAGFNRLSIGVQSLNDRELSLLGRIHTAEQSLDAYQAARQAGFENINIDLMFALPGQTIQDWRSTLQQALALFTEHVSLYELSIEEETRFWQESSRLDLPDEDERLEMYQHAIELLTSAGYEHYEVSNFARPGFRSRHNQVYWRNEPYFGFGAGAASFIDGVRSSNLKNPREYIDAVLGGMSPLVCSEKVSKETSMAETMMLALRTSDGLDIAAFRERYGADPTEVYRDTISRLSEDGLILLGPTSLRLTRRGLPLADEIAQAFLP